MNKKELYQTNKSLLCSYALTKTKELREEAFRLQKYIEENKDVLCMNTAFHIMKEILETLGKIDKVSKAIYRANKGLKE